MAKLQHPNCINFDTKQNPIPHKGSMGVNYKTSMINDDCFIDVQTKQSVGPGTYTLTNLYDCDRNLATTMATATSTPYMMFKHGYDIDPAKVDEATTMRLGLTKQFPKCPQQLFTRPYLTVPYAGRGPGNVELETQLLPGENTLGSRSCGALSGITIPNYFTPLIGHIEANIQNPARIITEFVDSGWIRGGAPTRLDIRDAEYAARCGHSYMNKTANAEFWHDKI